MSIERISIGPEQRKEETVNKDVPLYRQIDDLLQEFPAELQPRWEKEIDDLEDAEALAVLAAGLERRNEARRLKSKTEHDAVSPETLRMATAIRSMLMAHRVEIGTGGVADVLADPANRAVCYKVVRDMLEYSLCNGVVQEGSFLDELDGFSHSGVRTPRPYTTIVAPDFIAIGMERLPGYSLEEILESPELRASFDVEAYMARMRVYLAEIFEKFHVYHRDIKAGNMMYDAETGGAYLVDFGRSVHAYSAGDDFVEFTLGGRPVRVLNSNDSRLAYVGQLFKERAQQDLRLK
jgi:serine/threonine protein kinase